MFNLIPMEAAMEKGPLSTQVRHGEKLRVLIAEAAEALSMDKSAFLRVALEREALKVLEHQRKHRLTKVDAAAFMKAMNTPVQSSYAEKSAELFDETVEYAE